MVAPHPHYLVFPSEALWLHRSLEGFPAVPWDTQLFILFDLARPSQGPATLLSAGVSLENNFKKLGPRTWRGAPSKSHEKAVKALTIIPSAAAAQDPGFQKV